MKAVGERVPVQHRSQLRRDALLGAAVDLLQERALSEISVAEIARRARTSVGGVYARFKSKASLLLALAEASIDDITQVIGTGLGPSVDGLPLDEVVQAYTREMVRGFRKHRRVLLEAAKHLPPGAGARFRGRVAEFNRLVHDRMRSLLLAHRVEFNHADAARAANLALFMAAASAREAVITGNIAVYPVRLSDGELAVEIGRAMIAYLRHGGGATRGNDEAPAP